MSSPTGSIPILKGSSWLMLYTLVLWCFVWTLVMVGFMFLVDALFIHID